MKSHLYNKNKLLTKNKCNLCKSDKMELIISVDKQPIANRFLKFTDEYEYKHPKKLGLCLNCGLVQLIAPVPVEELASKFNWIRYNEPEDHLNDLANKLAHLNGITRKSVIGAISYKDASLQERLDNTGFKNNWLINPENHLNIKNKSAGIETIQSQLSFPLDEERIKHLSKADILLVRHILEHAHNIHPFVSALKRMINKSGYMVFEVPCCDNQIEKFDYSMIWEEHISYFTPATFRKFFDLSGLTLVHFERIHYQLEDALIGIATINNAIVPHKKTCPPNAFSVSKNEFQLAKKYGSFYDPYLLKLKRYLSNITKNVGKIAIFGAGHMATTFINIFDIGSLLEFAIDDNPNKIGLFMPGSLLPIRPLQALITENIKVCLLAVNPALEEKAIAKLNAFTNNKGFFLSIYHNSQYAWNQNSRELN
ncbi:MAG: class I SAM-dependent methyltransferase [Pseudomonadota bacterium]